MRRLSQVSDGGTLNLSREAGLVSFATLEGNGSPRDSRLLLPSIITLTAWAGANVGLCQAQRLCLPATVLGSAEVTGVVCEPTGFKGQRVLAPTSPHSECGHRGSGVSGVILRSKPVSRNPQRSGYSLPRGQRIGQWPQVPLGKVKKLDRRHSWGCRR